MIVLLIKWLERRFVELDIFEDVAKNICLFYPFNININANDIAMQLNTFAHTDAVKSKLQRRDYEY